MGPKELRSVVWPLMQQPMPRDEIARGVAITYKIDEDTAKAVVAQLDQDILTRMKHIRPSTRGTIELEKDKARSAIAPIEDIHFESMWNLACYIIDKG